MGITDRQCWLLGHLGLGALYLHGFGLGLVGLAGTRTRLATWGAVLLVVVALASVVTGTWLIYPWYRAVVPAGMALAGSPKAWLLAQGHLAGWQTFGMEWNEHIAWLSPMFATAVAAVLVQYRHGVQAIPETHGILRLFRLLAFGSGLVAAVLGGALNKVAPNVFFMQ